MFSIEHLHTLRTAEIEKIVTFFRPGALVLEVGAGTGHQALDLSERGINITAIEIPDSNYAQARVFSIIDYDGHHIPFDDASFDIVFSSNVMEHICELHQTNREIQRVLRSNGYCVHVIPTHIWRFWTTLSAFPTAFQYAGALKSRLLPRGIPKRNVVHKKLRLLRLIAYALIDVSREIRRLAGVWLQVARHLATPFFQRPHGARGNIISELWLFHPTWWRRAFREDGFELIRDEPMGLFYTGHMTFGSGLPLARREKLAKVLGSACHLYQMQPNSALRALLQGPTSAEDAVTPHPAGARMNQNTKRMQTGCARE